MSVRPIIDAGPGLNFLSINKERLLIAVLGPLSAPETVRGEVLRKSRQDDRFRAAATVWLNAKPLNAKRPPGRSDADTRSKTRRFSCHPRRCNSDRYGT